ncbi:tetratricopeptide repeat protein [bacterium]|nr:tetratricopeptide repeat protein [bacterium]
MSRRSKLSPAIAAWLVAAGLGLFSAGGAWADSGECGAAAASGGPLIGQQDKPAASAQLFDWEIAQLLNEGIEYQRKGELETAIALYERCRQYDARRIEVLPYLALALDQQGRPAEACGLYEEYLAQEPDDDLVRYNSAVAWAHAGDYVRALAQAEPLLERVSAEPVYTLLGVACMRLGDSDNALKYLRIASDMQPQRAEALSNLGAAYLRAGELEAASSCLAKALQLDPRNGAVLNNAGVVLDAKGRRQLAELAFREAAKLGVRNAEINEQVIARALNKADSEAAARFADKYNDIGQARLLYVLALLSEGRQREAAYELEGWQKEHEEADDSCAYLGSIYYQMGLYEPALEQYKRWLELQDSAAAHYNASLCLAGLQRYDEAEAEARRAYDMNPQSPEFIYNLARRSAALGHNEEASALYARLAREYPDFIDGLSAGAPASH